MDERLPRMLRTDARDNRDRVLDAARSLFAEHGIDVTMREVARHAEVGPATLYRRFPTKQALVDAAFADELRACRTIVEDGSADPDAWHGFRAVVERLASLNARNHGFVQAFAAARPGSVPFGEHREELLRMLADLAVRAQAAGALRADFVIDDLVLVLLAGRGLASVGADRREAAAGRFAALALEGFRAGPTNGTLPRPARLVTRSRPRTAAAGPVD